METSQWGYDGWSAVFPAKGPLVGTPFVAIPDDQVAAATGEDGWAILIVEGANLIADPYDQTMNPDWVIPGMPPPEPRPDPEPEPPTPVAILSLWNTNPAQVVVASGDIGKFHDGDEVTVAGVLAPYEFANGKHTIAKVGVPAYHFELVGVDLSAAEANIADPGMTVTPAAAAPAKTTTTRSTRK